MSDLFPEPEPWPVITLKAIYKAYPRHGAHKQAVLRIAQALDRICAGEIDSRPRTREEAVEFLRQRVEDSRQQFAGREKQHVPLMSTWLYQSRYLRKPSDQNLTKGWPQKRIERALEILRLYPKTPSVSWDDVSALSPTLVAIDKCICELESQGVTSPVEYLAGCVDCYANHVAHWPEEDLRFVPNAKRFFEEKRFSQDERFWTRTGNGFAEERRQLERISNRRIE